MPAQDAHVDGAAPRVARLARLADAATLRIDHGGGRLGDVVQQRGIQQGVDHHPRVGPDVPLGMVVRVLRRCREQLQGRDRVQDRTTRSNSLRQCGERASEG